MSAILEGYFIRLIFKNTCFQYFLANVEGSRGWNWKAHLPPYPALPPPFWIGVMLCVHGMSPN